MTTRLALAALLIVAALGALAPTGTAQGAPQMKIRFSFDHTHMTLDEQGRGEMVVHALLVAGNFTCASATKVIADVHMEYPDRWAGASFQPPRAEWTIPYGEPGPQSTKMYAYETGFDLAWDLESAPRQDARQAYTFTANNVKTDGSAPCQPSYGQVTVERSDPMVAHLPDRPEPSPDCSGSECGPTTAPFDPETTPNVGPALTLGVLAASVAAMRRRR